MADNLDVTAGSGTTVRTKDRTGVETQVMGEDLNIGGAAEKLAIYGALLLVAQTPVSVSGSATAVEIVAANTSRAWISGFNNSAANLYLRWRANPTTGLFSYLVGPGEHWWWPMDKRLEQGQLKGIWDSADGAFIVTEYHAA